MTFVKTDTILDKILAQKQNEIGENMAEMARRAREADPARPLALRRETVSLIAEVKHASPSKGVLIEDFDPVALGTTYAENGAAAIIDQGRALEKLDALVAYSQKLAGETVVQ